ncbi:hypothetical protein GYMLUDRAFT_64740 [Collybiopsis luxurians FD-317 M1]|uniref:C2H2-type domain-containing protein n=1 Tax=Collybiopsis luxurians FD-317 M1 TaxID=944289 RepID=A0A0D0AN37_9AGAR|nr:hypothetical protein GYMLUDRAFT_64740 [Collybiopsis luxurians FD-317 M1]
MAMNYPPEIDPSTHAGAREQNLWSRYDLGIEHPVPAPHSLPFNHHFEARRGIEVIEWRTVSLEPDFYLQSLTPSSPTVPQEDRIDVAVQQNWMSLDGFLESPVSGGAIELDHQYHHPVPENESAFSYADFDASEFSASPLTESPTDKPQPQPSALQTASQKPALRTVGSAAVVHAALKRRRVDGKTGEPRESRFRCPEPKCVQLGIGFTTKQNYDDHTRRHTGNKPFHCTLCHGVKASFTNKNDLRRHQRESKKCKKLAALLAARV